MRIVRLLLTFFGALLALVGLLWMGQGSGYFPYPASSFMIDQSPWIIRGAFVALVGLAMIFAGRRLIR
ncbi:hypothetical protein ASF69_14800 [Rhizobium sp. Leaf311]|uniref:hypothetical protein n=1 Tax=Rhizobium sp. Leaf311 TaxID=1736332 RepID=UPI0007153E09|nr:hypothetical protein [Rhizobium sp. Leaf311]KQQ58632.1 hypothetical protein ASF69_14800 [Rhizobium sp. Leaf311]